MCACVYSRIHYTHMCTHRVSMCLSLIRSFTSSSKTDHSFFFRFLISSLYIWLPPRWSSTSTTILILSWQNETLFKTIFPPFNTSHALTRNALDRSTNRPLVPALKRVHFSLPGLIETYHRYSFVRTTNYVILLIEKRTWVEQENSSLCIRAGKQRRDWRKLRMTRKRQNEGKR